MSSITQSLKDLSENDEFIKTLKQAGSLTSLVSIGLSLYEKFKDHLTTPEEKAFASLIRVALESAKEALTEIDKDVGREIKFSNLKTQQIIQDLFEAFNQQSDWNSYLPDHPAIVKFRNIFIENLHNTGYD